MQAQMELRSRGLPVDYAREQGTPNPDPAADAASIYDWVVEIRGGNLYGSWHLYFGEQLFSDSSRAGSALGINIPLFVHYSINVDGERGLTKEIEFEGTPGDNRESDVLLIPRLARGHHDAYIHLHIQYVDSSGEAKILNKTSIVLQVDR